jgi:hypothetical protein
MIKIIVSQTNPSTTKRNARMISKTFFCVIVIKKCFGIRILDGLDGLKNNPSKP